VELCIHSSIRLHGVVQSHGRFFSKSYHGVALQISVFWNLLIVSLLLLLLLLLLSSSSSSSSNHNVRLEGWIFVRLQPLSICGPLFGLLDPTE
jgi:hypothetical protein